MARPRVYRHDVRCPNAAPAGCPKPAHPKAAILEIVPSRAGQRGLEVLPRRWAVEQTFGWLGRQRRLSKDHEALPESSAAWGQIAMSRLMLRRLTRNLAF